MTIDIMKCPKKDKDFKRYWELFVPDVANRENFKLGHLQQLEILCDLFIEYHALAKIVKDEGRFYQSDGRYGEKIMLHPAVARQDKVLAEIRGYSKLLGVTLHKDTGNVEKEAVDEWE